ncbi:MAG TPA: neutral/alkaline non-lysosomal ceramidase N-terminal domain-containing protein [Dehalococcoidia bacterium]|nr:neutral/alkaline non-lysosomal ceramidase N-terminal domain-containing protein [Dehalococcoidia bacterium]
MADMLQIGASVVDITPGVGLAMGGYGARQGVSTGIHDPLNVRTLVLHDGHSHVVLAICDLVGVPPDLVAAAREQIEKDTGVPAENVAIGATHTHSGPLLRDVDVPGYIPVTAKKIAGSVAMALRSMTPVPLKAGVANVTTVSQNRRHPEGPLEETAKVLLAAPEGGRAPVATVVNYACHATVMEYDNLDYSADFPGAAMRFLERNLGGTGVYVQGCCGNINPVWMRHDFAEVERIGGILGAAAVRTAHEMRPLGEGQWCVNLNWSEQTPKPSPGGLLTGLRLDSARTFVDLTRRTLPPIEEIEAEIRQLETALEEAGTDVARRRQVRPRLNSLRLWRAQRQRGGGAGGSEALEIQAFRISAECAIVTLPGEFFVEVARDLEQRAGLPFLLIAGYTNGTAGYFPTQPEFDNFGYEVGQARFVPGATEVVTEEAARLVRSLY